MIDTTDLTSYYPGYDEYCESKVEKIEEDYDFYEDLLIEKEIIKMERKIIDLKATNLTLNEILKLENYIWKKDKLIPSEMLVGE